MFLCKGLWIFLPFVLVLSEEWSYEGSIGPPFWPAFDTVCNGTNQSPINVATNLANESNLLRGITFHGYYDVPSLMNLTNNGHTVFIELPESHLFIKDDWMPSRYIFSQFHFHWGKSDDKGSEHTFDGQHFPMELHLVHFKEDYKTLGEAMKKSDGIAVLAVLFEVAYADNVKFEKLIRNLPKVAYKGDSIKLKRPFPLSFLLPENRDLYFRYHGSLTTPHCYESVSWTVFRDTIKVSDDQLDEFRFLKESYLGNQILNLEDNFRPLQPLNERPIFKSVIRHIHKSSAIAWKLSLNIASICTLIMVIML